MAQNISFGDCNPAWNSWHCSEEKYANLGSRVFWLPKGKSWQEAKTPLGRHLNANGVQNSVYMLVNIAQLNSLHSVQNDSGKQKEMLISNSLSSLNLSLLTSRRNAI